MLGVGHQSAACETNPESGMCAPVREVYSRTTEREKPGNALVILREKERTLVCWTEEDVEYGEEEVCKEKIRVERVHMKPDRVEEQPVPVRKHERVQRIWIYPYVDRKGNFVEGHFIFTVLEEGKWLLPDGSSVE